MNSQQLPRLIRPGSPPAGLSRRKFLAQAAALAAGSGIPFWAYAQNFVALEFDPRFRKAETWTDPCGLHHDRISPYWQWQTEVLPCFQGVAFPGYAEWIVEVEKKDVKSKLGITIDDAFYRTNGVPEGRERVIIHLWKGLCQKFRGDNRNPGGCGAELGIYLERTRDWLETKEKEKNKDVNSFWGGGIEKLALDLQGQWGLMMAVRRTVSQDVLTGKETMRTWYPAPELKAKLRFQLLDPYNNNAVLIDTARQESDFVAVERTHPAYVMEDYRRARPFWCTDWISERSYRRWEKSRKNKTTLHPVGLTMKYWINDIEQKEWPYQSGDDKCAPHRPLNPALSGCQSQRDIGLKFKKT